MHRILNSKYFVSAVSLTVGAGIGAAWVGLKSEGLGTQEQLDGVLKRIPVLPIPSVDALATDLTHYQKNLAGTSRATSVMKYGFPSLSNIKTRESYVVSYDSRNRTAHWVIEQLNGETLTGDSDRKFCDFKEDDTVHSYHRAANADYKGSGFDRGHLAAAANHKWSQKAMEETFYLSNVAPQNPHLNQNAWNNLEKYCRALTRHYQNVFVCTGPLYLPSQVVPICVMSSLTLVGTDTNAFCSEIVKSKLLCMACLKTTPKRSFSLKIEPAVPNEPVHVQ
nr:PREDICTED: endonuclease G, mitochondrial isoform X2 [Lepisosteus oculatus]